MTDHHRGTENWEREVLLRFAHSKNQTFDRLLEHGGTEIQ